MKKSVDNMTCLFCHPCVCYLSHSWPAISSFSIRGRMNFMSLSQLQHLWLIKSPTARELNAEPQLCASKINASSTKLFLWTLTERHDYFKNRYVRNAHVFEDQ